LLVDTVHLVICGFGAAGLPTLEPGSIGYAQLSDTKLRPAEKAL
jgi:hypothetical protein